MYTVLQKFADLQDRERHVYNVGDEFPHDGRTIDQSRIEELMGSGNKLGAPVIEEVKSVAKEVKEDVNDDGIVSGTEELVRPKSDKVSRKVRDRKRDSDIEGLED